MGERGTSPGLGCALHGGTWERRVQRQPAGAWPAWLLSLFCLLSPFAGAQTAARSKVWVSDTGDGHYRNPVLFADYSDPDAIRIGDTFYLVASSFDQVPGLPLLESKDLVNWTLIGHALQVQPPADVYRATHHGSGVWAPAIRYHAGEFFIFYPDPDYGIYVIKAKSVEGPWSEPKLVRAAKGWIDPCPLWDDDGKAYLVNGVAASRSGMKNQLIVSRMDPDGERLLDQGTLVIDGHGTDVTLEGPKFYKRNGFYYIFAPAGGVKPGYQLVFRSKSVYGPYERREVLAQGRTAINGPHQGAWVNTASGEDWFVHFQDRGAFGRVVLLEPMRWENDWPVIGMHQDKDGVGEPVESYRKPATGPAQAVATPPDTDEFNASEMGRQWQWQANPQPGWAFPAPGLGVLRMVNVPVDPAVGERIWTTPNVISQKFPGPEFTASVKMTATGFQEGDRAGLVVMGRNYAWLAIRRKKTGLELVYGTAHDAEHSTVETETTVARLDSPTLFVRAHVAADARTTFEYSTDGQRFQPAGEAFTAVPGVWIGAKLGLFAQGHATGAENGYLDVDWFRLEK